MANMGRPRKPEHLKAKPITKTLRFPVPAMEEGRKLSKLLKSGVITVQDLEEFIKAKQKQ